MHLKVNLNRIFYNIIMRGTYSHDNLGLWTLSETLSLVLNPMNMHDESCPTLAAIPKVAMETGKQIANGKDKTKGREDH
jgi:hypothetical protein